MNKPRTSGFCNASASTFVTFFSSWIRLLLPAIAIFSLLATLLALAIFMFARLLLLLLLLLLLQVVIISIHCLLLFHYLLLLLSLILLAVLMTEFTTARTKLRNPKADIPLEPWVQSSWSGFAMKITGAGFLLKH